MSDLDRIIRELSIRVEAEWALTDDLAAVLEQTIRGVEELLDYYNIAWEPLEGHRVLARYREARGR